jgi:drug/metabolite transporter (DMT)-like permease
MNLITAYKNQNSKRATKFLAYGALITVTLLWALAGPVIKITLEEIPPMHFLFFRLLIVCLVILPPTIMQLQQHPVKTREIPTLIILGILGQTSLVLTFLGYQYALAIDASIITLISPVLSIGAGYYYFKEKITFKTTLGIILATVGTALIIVEPLLLNSSTLISREMRVFGNGLILSGTLAFLLYTLWSKYALGENSSKLRKVFQELHIFKLEKNRSPMLLTFITFYVGMASLVPLVFLENKGFMEGQSFDLASISLTGILGILYMAIFSSIVAYTLFQWALTQVTVSDTAFFNYLSPIFTLPFAYLLLAEIPSKITLIGGAIIGIGVVIAEQKKS